MFTGLVEETGEFLALKHTSAGARLTVHAAEIAKGIQPGDSIAVNGCCLTVAAQDGNVLGFDLLRETLDRTNLGQLAAGARVNLERALAAHARLGGHFVQGHIDAASAVLGWKKVDADFRLEIALPREFARYVACKGSVAIDGISLTVAEIHDASFVVWIIPHTFSATNLRGRHDGELVNLEFDLLAKYVERLLGAR